MRGRFPGLQAVGISVLLHALVVLPVLLFAQAPQAIAFETVRIHLVAATAPAPEPVAAQPLPEPETPKPVVEAKEPEPEPPPPKEENVEKPPETPPQQTTDASDAAVGNSDMNVRAEGREFPYPDYLANVIVQVRRFFRWEDTSRPRGEVYFEILPDGSVRNIRIARPSGNTRFDLRVMGAVESAGNRGAFGPLPEGYIAPSLPVLMEIEPPR